MLKIAIVLCFIHFASATNDGNISFKELRNLKYTVFRKFNLAARKIMEEYDNSGTEWLKNVTLQYQHKADNELFIKLKDGYLAEYEKLTNLDLVLRKAKDTNSTNKCHVILDRRVLELDEYIRDSISECNTHYRRFDAKYFIDIARGIRQNLDKKFAALQNDLDLCLIGEKDWSRCIHEVEREMNSEIINAKNMKKSLPMESLSVIDKLILDRPKLKLCLSSISPRTHKSIFYAVENIKDCSWWSNLVCP